MTAPSYASSTKCTTMTAWRSPGRKPGRIAWRTSRTESCSTWERNFMPTLVGGTGSIIHVIKLFDESAMDFTIRCLIIHNDYYHCCCYCRLFNLFDLVWPGCTHCVIRFMFCYVVQMYLIDKCIYVRIIRS